MSGAFKRGEVVIARLPSGDAYARFVGTSADRREPGLVVDHCGVRVVVASAKTAPRAVQS